MPQRASLPCRRRADRLLQAFHWACDSGDPDLARAMLGRLVADAEKPLPILPGGVDRRARVTLLGPYERLQNLLLHTGQMPWDDAPGLTA